MKLRFSLLLVLVIVIVACTNNQSAKKNKVKEDQKPIERKAYVPDGLYISAATYHYHINEFTDFSITLSNNTSENFKMVKYRVTLFSRFGNTSDKHEVFSRSYEYLEKLYSGDMIPIRIHDLDGFSMDHDISNQTNWRWDAIIENSDPIKY
jgi:hypothetical protein